MIRRLKQAARAVLERRGLSHDFNDTRLYAVYLRVMYPQTARARQKHLMFYRRLLNRYDLVFDIGANNGDKTRLFTRCVDRIISVEPVQECVGRLVQRFGHDRRITIVPEGVSDSEGVGTISVYRGDHAAYSTFSQKWVEEQGPPARTAEVKLTTLDDLISRFGKPSYIKIHVEGYELNVLRALHTAVPLVSIECNLPLYLAETLECIALLARLSANCLFNYCTAEPPCEFALGTWIPAPQMRAMVGETKLRYMEVFCRSARPAEA
jgi:FkbM family methyltransferase